MNFLVILFSLVFVSMIFLAIYFAYFQKEESGEWVWVGPGDNPFDDNN